MGLFDFIEDAGSKIFGKDHDRGAEGATKPLSTHLREMWRRTADRTRGLDYHLLWGANEPDLQIVSDKPPIIGGDWEGHTTLARASLSYEDALNPAAAIHDLVNQAISLAEYLGKPPELTTEILEAACASYFVDDREAPATYA